MSSAAVVTALLKRHETHDDEGKGRRHGRVVVGEDGSAVRLTLTEEARLLIQALQHDEISDEEMLKMVNTAPKKYDPKNPEEFAKEVRARKIFKYLDLNNDGVVGADDLHEIKGRLYRSAEDFAQGDDEGQAEALRTEFMHNEEAVRAFAKTTASYLEHREGYARCCIHLLIFALFVGVLTTQAQTTLEFESRRAISRVVFPEEVSDRLQCLKVG